MLEHYYMILNCNENSSDEDIQREYEALKKKYSEERFLEGEAGNYAAKKLTEVETAYNEIMNSRKENKERSGNLFEEVEKAIRDGDLQAAQRFLDAFDERNAEWHYLQSVVFYKKNWKNESKKQLEIAMSMNSEEKKYKDAYNTLVEGMNAENNANNNANNQQNGNAGANDWNHSGNMGYDERQMGGMSCMDTCCQIVACNALLNCCCNCR